MIPCQAADRGFYDNGRGVNMNEVQMISAGLTATQIRYMQMYLQGSSQQDIARKYCVVPSSVSHAIKAARKKLQQANLQDMPLYDHDYTNI